MAEQKNALRDEGKYLVVFAQHPLQGELTWLGNLGGDAGCCQWATREQAIRIARELGGTIVDAELFVAAYNDRNRALWD